VYEVNLDQANTTRFLFGDDEGGAYGQGNGIDESFPTLVRREDQMVSLFPVFGAMSIVLGSGAERGWQTQREGLRHTLKAGLSQPFHSFLGTMSGQAYSLCPSLLLQARILYSFAFVLYIETTQP
jgi:hypothetical protein